jgi:hypothetical protein
MPQILWGTFNSPQLLQRENDGADNFQTCDLLLSRLALETFRFGTAIINPPNSV